MILSVSGYAQKKTTLPQAKPTPAQSAGELSKLRDEYIKATKDYQASLQKLLALYQDRIKKAVARRDKS